MASGLEGSLEARVPLWGSLWSDLPRRGALVGRDVLLRRPVEQVLLRGEGGLLRGQLGELSADISQNNPTCSKLTWGLCFRRIIQAVMRGRIGQKKSHNSSS